MAIEVVAVVTLRHIVMVHKSKKQNIVYQFERVESISSDLKGIISEKFGNERVNLTLVLGPSEIEVNTTKKIQSNWKYKYFPKAIEEEARILASKPKVSHYTRCITLEEDNVIYLNIYSTTIASLNIIMEEFDTSKINVVSIIPLIAYIGDKLCHHEGNVLFSYTTIGREGKSLLYLLLYKNNFLVAFRELYIDVINIEEEINRTFSYVKTNLRDYTVDKLMMLNNKQVDVDKTTMEESDKEHANQLTDFLEDVLVKMFKDKPIRKVTFTEIILAKPQEKDKINQNVKVKNSASY